MEKIDPILESKWSAYLLTFLFFVVGLILALTMQGTCDDGDSIFHYQYARFAPLHPELFFHHWAKPLFVLLSCPASQFGFTGIKIFNLLLSSLSLLLVFKICGELNISRKTVALVFLFMSPAWIVHTLSGLTEPLFAFILTLCVWFYLSNRIVVAVLIVSFLPFVRSEGLIICGVFSTLLLIEKRFFLLPLLTIGHVVYSIAGYPVHHSLFWTFTKIPYAKMSSVYGTGSWEHFFLNLPFVIGIPLYALLIAGLFILPVMLLKNFSSKMLRGSFLVYGCSFGYFLAHVVFWALGIFNSFGLLRVLVAVLPLFAIIQLRGLNALIDSAFLKTYKSKQIAFAICLVTVMAFPFIKTKYGWNLQKQFGLNIPQQQMTNAVNLIKSSFPDYKKAVYYYDASFIGLLLDLDPFNENISRPVWKGWSAPREKMEFVFWDNWYSAFEMNTELKSVEGNPRFTKVKEFVDYDEWGYEKKLVVFKSNVAAKN